MRWIIFALVLCSGSAAALERVAVLALFPGKAMLQIDGQRKVLSNGQSFGEEFRLIEATPREARVSIKGREQVLQLGSAVSASYAEPAQREIRLVKRKNAFFLDGLINGQGVRMLVDTGATHVALSERQAKALGVPYVVEGRESGVRTASGVSRAYEVKLRSLKVGEVTFNNVRAMVVEGEYPKNVLLGMNVLKHFEVEQQNNLMILRSR